MIISSPTGFYRNVLPSKPADGGNVTFTISTTSPPRSALSFPKIPPGLAFKKRQVKQLDEAERRSSLGDLIFTVSKASRALAGNNAQQFEIGSVLSFEDGPTRSVDPMLVSEKTQNRHDLFVIDYEKLDLDESDKAVIEESAAAVHKTLVSRLNDIKRQRADLEEQVKVNQKVINEIKKTLNALEIISENSDTDVSGMQEELNAKLDIEYATRDAYIDEANQLAAEAVVVKDKINTISTVTK